MSEGIPAGTPEDMPDRMPEMMSEDIPVRMPDMPDRMHERLGEEMPDRMSEDMSQNIPDMMSEILPERVSGVMPERMSEDAPARMSDDMPDSWLAGRKGLHNMCQNTCRKRGRSDGRTNIGIHGSGRIWDTCQNTYQRSGKMSKHMAENMPVCCESTGDARRYVRTRTSEHIPEYVPALYGRWYVRTLWHMSRGFVRIVRHYMCPAFFQISCHGGSHLK